MIHDLLQHPAESTLPKTFVILVSPEAVASVNAVATQELTVVNVVRFFLPPNILQIPL
jgi:hypothetical protein